MQPVSPRHLERQMLFEQLAATLEDQILSGELEAGDRLPAEGALAERYGVSRPVVREALGRLRERHLIETRNGNGTFVRHPEAEDLTGVLLRHLRLASPGPQAIANLYEARVAVETMTARLAAQRATDEDLAEMRVHLTTMRDHQTAEGDWTKADLAFHQALAQASHNPFLPIMLQPLTQLIEGSIRASHRDPAAVRTGLEAHERIWQALCDRDPELAAEAVRSHLADSKQRLMAALSDQQHDEAERPNEEGQD